VTCRHQVPQPLEERIIEEVSVFELKLLHNYFIYSGHICAVELVVKIRRIRMKILKCAYCISTGPYIVSYNKAN
jgi:hypothetical protein